MDVTRHRIVLRRIYMGYALVAAVVYGLLMAFVFPWWNAASHPVVVTLGAGSAQVIELAFDKDEEPLKLAPLRDPAGYLWYWATELPPRPRYDLALVFPDGTVGEVILKDLEIIRLAPERDSIHLDYDAIVVPEDGSVRVQPVENGNRLFAAPGSRLPLRMAMPVPTAYEWFVAGVQATIGYLVLALVLLLLIVTMLRFPDGIQAYRKRPPAYEWLLVVIFSILGSLAHVFLVRHAVPAFTPGESGQHLLAALSSHVGMAVEQGGAARGLRPGYPLLLEWIGGRTDWDMSRVTFVQAVLVCVSVSLLALAVTPLVPGYFVVPVVLLALLSPPLVWASRHVGPQSLLAGGILTGVAVFLCLWQVNGWRRWAGFVLFGVVAAGAVATAVGGFVLLLLPAGLLAGTAWWCYSIRGWEFYRLSVFWKTLGQVSIPLAMAVLACVISSRVGPLGPRDCVFASSFNNAPFVAGLFDVRALEDPEDYAEFLRAREASGYVYDPEVLSPYPDLAHASLRRLPLQAILLAWGRLTGWGLFLPDIRTHDQSRLVRDYTIPNGSRTAAEAEAVREVITGLMRQTGVAVHVMDKRSNKNIVLFNNSLVAIYPWFYRLLFLAALAAWMIGLAERKYLAAALVMPYLGNILLQVATLHVSSESIQSLDALLWFAALAGLLASSRKSTQKPTDEGDRRTMAPIRPKRLLTRFQSAPPFAG